MYMICSKFARCSCRERRRWPGRLTASTPSRACFRVEKIGRSLPGGQEKPTVLTHVRRSFSCTSRRPSVTRGPVADCRCRARRNCPDLENQRRVLEVLRRPWCSPSMSSLSRKLAAAAISSGRNVARMDCVEARQGRLSHKDRLVRFGFQWFERFCAEHGTELRVAGRQAMIFLDKIERADPSLPSLASGEGAVKPGGSYKDRAT
jgi:hypothetical protein